MVTKIYLKPQENQSKRHLFLPNGEILEQWSTIPAEESDRAVTHLRCHLKGFTHLRYFVSQKSNKNKNPATKAKPKTPNYAQYVNVQGRQQYSIKHSSNSLKENNDLELHNQRFF